MRAQNKKEKQNKIVFFTSMHHLDILDTFGVDVSNDVMGIHPDKICSHCKNTSRNFRRAAAPGSGNPLMMQILIAIHARGISNYQRLAEGPLWINQPEETLHCRHIFWPLIP
jgi:hypothetical protein